MTHPDPDDQSDGLDAARRALAESERRYRTLFETMAQGVYYQDKEGNITTANPAMLALLGVNMDHLQGREPLPEGWRMMREDGTPLPTEERASIRAIRTRKPVMGAIICFFNPKFGEIRWLRANATPELDPVTGESIGAYTIFEDITERRRSEQAATEAARTIATVLENVTDAYFALDKEWRYIYVNRQGEQTAGFSREELIGRRIWDVYPEILGTGFQKQFERAMTGGSPVTFEEYYVGSQTWYRAHAYATPEGLAFYLRNITNERRASEERRFAEDRQREFMRDVLASVTGGKLRLCFSASDLPSDPPSTDGIPLTLTEGLRPLRRRAEEAAHTVGFDSNRTYDLIPAAGEAGMNAVVHAGGGGAYVRILPGQVVQIWIVDEGPGISIENLPRATLEKGYTTAGTLGHGMKMMLRAVDRVYLRTTPNGATVVLEQSPHPRSDFMLNDW
ncbi:MAG: PAS domain S-box protein [Capsulimonas sp.]|uniref:PAS domain S-box protein n=1 Tax=Capsulimonas sp. TaxID=2494211 RepID=UPI003266A0E9